MEKRAKRRSPSWTRKGKPVNSRVPLGTLLQRVKSVKVTVTLDNGKKVSATSKVKRQQSSPDPNFPYLIFVGGMETMEKIAGRGVTALNPKTMKWQIVDKTAKYRAIRDAPPNPHGTATLYSDKDLKKIAEEKGLVWG